LPAWCKHSSSNNSQNMNNITVVLIPAVACTSS
jgi:hypothetical protein